MRCERRKFFGKQNGTAPKTQSKLSFSTKPNTEKKHSVTEPDVPPKISEKDAEPREESKSSAEVEENEVESTKDVDVKEEANGDDMEVDSSPPAEAGKKRQVEEEEEDSDDAPPTKRARGRPPKAAPAKKDKSTQKQAQKHAKTVKKTKVVEPEEDEDEEDVAAPVKVAQEKRNKVETTSPKEEPVSSPQDEEDLPTSEEESPEVAKKAREKVQTTLKGASKGATKDPYPDWKPGEPIPYAALCTTFSKIEMTTKRLEILAHCSLFLRQVLRLTPQELLPTVLLMINKLAADYVGIELGIGESLIMKAISESTGRSLQQIKSDQKEIGDLGLVAAKSRSKQPTMFKPKPLTVAGVHKGLMTIATIEGQGGQGRKVDGIKKLLSAADAHNVGKAVDIEKDKGGPSEAKFIVRFLEGKLRLGLAERTVVVALAQAMRFHEMEQDGKTPSSADMLEAENILKSVYR